MMWILSSYMAHDHVELRPGATVARAVNAARMKGITYIIGADANIHHQLWGSTDTNRRGEDIIDFVLINNLIKESHQECEEKILEGLLWKCARHIRDQLASEDSRKAAAGRLALGIAGTADRCPLSWESVLTMGKFLSHHTIMVQTVCRTEDILRWAITSFYPYKSSVPDGIIPADLQHNLDVIIPWLLEIYGACLSGHIPVEWTRSNVM
ncbi:hypothetical protein EVAR_91315_1 [Eumeta japonica]|uniref:Endonuclease/exonuclease/phosphatase domain-containing protein n=1 Tax=Eumeta variegata TaxID=151549 RepID=A0A4C1SVW4_EUMVA|nr:hypothetical protein EVAR_91315_1 [Eumeta japonica]